jgi:2'-5' RNA ligase
MRIQIALAYDPSGTYVGIEFEERGVSNLLAACKDLDIDNLYRPNQVHTTLVYSPETPYVQVPSSLVGQRVQMANPKFEMFGPEKDTLVVSFESDLLQARHAELLSVYGLEHTYRPYKPHITLSEQVYKDYTDIEAPGIELVISVEKADPIDDGRPKT